MVSTRSSKSRIYSLLFIAGCCIAVTLGFMTHMSSKPDAAAEDSKLAPSAQEELISTNETPQKFSQTQIKELQIMAESLEPKKDGVEGFSAQSLSSRAQGLLESKSSEEGSQLIYAGFIDLFQRSWSCIFRSERGVEMYFIKELTDRPGSELCLLNFSLPDQV